MKRVRVVISVSCFTLMALLFLNFPHIATHAVTKGLLYLQFVPSLLKFLNGAALGAAGFIVVVILTICFGRVYCSTICPLGTLQDVIGFTARKLQKPRDFQFSAPHNLLRYSIFTLTILAWIVGSGFMLNLLDPFSSFGRILSNLLHPLVLLMNNGAAIVFEPLNVPMLHRMRWAVIAPVSVSISIAMLVLIARLAAKHGRLYCNTVCPVGTLLALLSKISLLQIRINPDTCLGCKLCESVCKAGCIDSRSRTIDISRCVGCYNCLTVCPKQGLRFENRWKRHVPPAVPEQGEQGRRGFILSGIMYFWGLTGFSGQAGKSIRNEPTTIPLRVTNPISPPGSVSIEHFTSTCTACHLCVSICPSHVLVPSFLEFGFLGMMQPRMNFASGHCNYDCTACMNVCPSGALLPLAVEKKKLTQLGIAKFIKENCVVYTDHTNCGACSEHCPTKAVNMVPYPHPANPWLVIPAVNPNFCIGCGGCEHACPTEPFKAIYVDGNPVHRLAQKPAVQKIEENDNDDFPF